MRLSVLPFLLPALLATPALADNPNVPRWYIGLSTSLVMLQNVDIDNTAGLGADTLTMHPGIGVSAAFGYRLSNNFRTELEVAYRTNDIDDDLNVTSDATSAPHTSVAIMSNLYFDFRNSSRFTPYIGAGIGAARVNNPRYYVLYDGMSNPIEHVPLEEWTLAYQGMAGLTYTLDPGRSRKELYFGYRYFTGQDTRVHSKILPEDKFYFPNDSHNFEIGGRVYF